MSKLQWVPPRSYWQIAPGFERLIYAAGSERITVTVPVPVALHKQIAAFFHNGPSRLEFDRVTYGGVMVKFTAPLGTFGPEVQ